MTKREKWKLLVGALTRRFFGERSFAEASPDPRGDLLPRDFFQQLLRRAPRQPLGEDERYAGQHGFGLFVRDAPIPPHERREHVGLPREPRRVWVAADGAVRTLDNRGRGEARDRPLSDIYKMRRMRMFKFVHTCARTGGQSLVLISNVEADLGIGIYPDDGEDASTLIDRADAAMYIAKRRRVGIFAFNSDEAESEGRVDSASP